MTTTETTIFSKSFGIYPAQNGSFIIRVRRDYNSRDNSISDAVEVTSYAFTTLSDMMTFLNEEAKEAKEAKRAVPTSAPFNKDENIGIGFHALYK